MRYPDDFDDTVCSTKADFMRLPGPVRTAYCIHQLEAQVNNGGFHQFFVNSSGEYVRETLDALSSIGAPETYALLEKAVTIAFPQGYPDDPADYETGAAEFEGVADSLAQMDDAFYRYVEPLADLVNGYLARGT